MGMVRQVNKSGSAYAERYSAIREQIWEQIGSARVLPAPGSKAGSAAPGSRERRSQVAAPGSGSALPGPGAGAPGSGSALRVTREPWGGDSSSVTDSMMEPDLLKLGPP